MDDELDDIGKDSDREIVPNGDDFGPPLLVQSDDRNHATLGAVAGSTARQVASCMDDEEDSDRKDSDWETMSNGEPFMVQDDEDSDEYDDDDLERFNRAAGLGNEGSDLLDRGDARGALAKYEESRACGQTIRDANLAREVEGAALGNLGAAYDELGQLDKAIEYFDQARVIAREIGDRQLEGKSLGNLGIAYANLGQYGALRLYAKAIICCEQALVISREIGDRQGEGNALGSLGVAYFSLGQYNKAIEHQAEALVIARKIGNQQGEGNALINLGAAHLFLSPPAAAAAREQLQAAARVFDTIWRDLGRDDDRARITFGGTHAVTTGPSHLQLAHALLNDPRAALEVADGAKARSLAVLLAQQRVASSRAPSRPASDDGDDDDRAAATATDTTADLDEPLSFADLAATAVEQRACIVVYSVLSGGHDKLFIWVLDSKGTLVVFKDIPLEQVGRALFSHFYAPAQWVAS